MLKHVGVKALDVSWIESRIIAAGGVPISAKDIQDLYAAQIRAILSLTEHPITTYKEITPDLLERLDIDYYHVPVRARRVQCVLLSEAQERCLQEYVKSITR